MNCHSAENLAPGDIKSDHSHPYMERVAEHIVSASVSLSPKPESRKFKVECNAGDTGHLLAASDSVFVRVAQRIHHDGNGEMWESLHVKCEAQEDGTLNVEVVVFHPDWDEPKCIASLQSRPTDPKPGKSVLYCDLDHRLL